MPPSEPSVVIDHSPALLYGEAGLIIAVQNLLTMPTSRFDEGAAHRDR
jgi:hypothetical protein